LGFEAPTLVQAQAIPVILSGRHVYPSVFFSVFFQFMYLILIQCFIYIYTHTHLTEIKIYRLVNAATGTGKTVAYLAPIIHHLHSYPSRIDRENGTFGM
jgi:ATP-dependent RNA helicase DDX31/DBP7